MTKKILEINLDNKIKFDIFSQAEENLYIDLLIKTDEKAREKAKEFAWYLEDLKEYVEFENEKEVDEIIDFLKSKTEIEISQEEKIKYMEDKFDIIDLIKINKDWGYTNPFRKGTFTNQDIEVDDYYIFYDKNNKEFLSEELKVFLQDYFPIFWKYDKNIFLADYFCNLKRNSLDKNWEIERIIEDKHFEEQENPEQIHEDQEDSYYFNFSKNLVVWKEYFLLIPYLLPIYRKWTNENPWILNWDLKISKFELKKEIEKEKINNFIFVENNNLLNKEKLINKIFSKTNLFCDYRFFDRSMLE